MNSVTILLISALFFSFIVIIVLVVRNSSLVLKNKLYQEFVRRTPVKKFIVILDKVSDKSLDSDIMLMLQKYFELVLRKLDKSKVLSLLADLNKSKHSDTLKKSLINAIENSNYSVFGLALAISINNHDDESTIKSFLATLSEEQRKEEYKTAFNFLKEDYDRRVWDYPLEFRRPVELAMKEFEEKSK